MMREVVIEVEEQPTQWDGQAQIVSAFYHMHGSIQMVQPLQAGPGERETRVSQRKGLPMPRTKSGQPPPEQKATAPFEPRPPPFARAETQESRRKGVEAIVPAQDA